ncbi:MAG: hypothetical protein HDR80_09925 [Bacteroides sp.]|nr:hypothetical protein [Bacteroides sp.]
MKHLFPTLILAAVTTAAGWAATPLAPAPVKDVSAFFHPGSLDGIVYFTAPTLSAAGNPIEGNLKFTITANGQELSSGDVYSGVYRSEEIVAPTKGVYELKVVVSNEYGPSDPVTYKVGAGYYPPQAPQPRAFINEQGTISVNWANVYTLTDGSAATSGMTYDVVRQPDGKTLATGTTATTVIDSDIPEDLHAYTYEVTAIDNATRSEAGVTSPIVVGVATAPWTCGFSTAELDFVKVLDANGDGNTWTDYTDEVTCDVGPDGADDWLFFPPVKLMKGGHHTVSIDMRLRDSDFPGKFEIVYGYAQNREAMTMTAIPATWFNNSTVKTFSGTITSDSDEPVYIALHNITGPSGWYIMASNFKIGPATEGAIPTAITEFAAVPDIDGANEITLTLTAPSEDLNGGALEELTKVELFRDGTLIHTFEKPALGEELTFTDKEADGLTPGEHTYEAVAHNRYGEGVMAKITSFAGINLPSCPLEANAYETDEYGWVTVNWSPVTTNIDGNPVRPESVTYNIYTYVQGTWIKIAKDLTETEHTFQIMIPGEEQLFWQFGVTAENSAGENEMSVLTEQVPVGEPWTAPYEDSFPNLNTVYSYVTGSSDTMSYITNGSDRTFEEMATQDGDNGMLYMFGAYQGSQAYLQTAKVSLADTKNPMLTFYAYNYYVDEPNANTIEILVSEGKELVSEATYTLSDFKTEGWHRIEHSLKDHAGKNVQFFIIFTTNSYQYVQFDNLQVRDRFDNDLEIKDVDFNEGVKTGNSASFAVTVNNAGLKDAGEFTVTAETDGKTVAEQKVASLASDGHATVTLNVPHTILTPENVSYTVRVSLAGDQNPANDTMEDLNVLTITPNYPTVSDLKAEYPEGKPAEVTLSWSAPDVTTAFSDDVTETFETAAPWATSVTGWTFVDVDKLFIYGFEPGGFELPQGAPTAMSRQSWWVCDAAYAPLCENFSDPQYYKAHSGNKYIISMAVTDEEYTSMKSDDWAISPRLCGASQTVSFWAKSMLADCDESFEVWYSTTGSNLSDFEKLDAVNSVPWSWTQYYYTLPENTQYFAIRCVSRDMFVLMLDDINYIPAGTAADLTIEGYNVYRGDERLNTEPVSGNKFVVENSPAGATYRVTTLYAGRGESLFSNEAVPGPAGMAEIDFTAVRVLGNPGAIDVLGAAGQTVAVYTADGRLADFRTAAPVEHIPAATGIYFVNVGGKTYKTVVK